MKLVRVPELVLPDLLINVEFHIAAGVMSHDAIANQVKILWSYMPENKFNPRATEEPKPTCEVIDLCTKLPL